MIVDNHALLVGREECQGPLVPFASCPQRALPTETKIESEISRCKSGTFINFRDVGEAPEGVVEHEGVGVCQLASGERARERRRERETEGEGEIETETEEGRERDTRRCHRA